MKIVHVCLCAPYTLGFGYQDNLLAKYHKKSGNEVTVITTSLSFNIETNKEEIINAEVEYENEVKIIRLKDSISRKITSLVRHYKNFYKTLEKEKPDFIFVHGVAFYDSLKLCKYLKRHPNVLSCVDNHADRTNTGLTPFMMLINKTVFRYLSYKLNKYVDQFFGVIPVRCEFLSDVYGVPRDRIKLLVMGADDELLDNAKAKKEITRKNLDYNKDDFVIITGGKIDKYKSETLVLMDAVKKYKNIKLLVFGSVNKEIKQEFESKITKNIKYVGWLNQEKLYEYLCCADFAIFPGRHSVVWEQTVAAGIPSAFKNIENTHHVDINGNCIFIKDNRKETIESLLEIILNKNNYNKMYVAANKEEKNRFLYSNIAEASIKDTIEGKKEKVHEYKN